MTSEIRERVKNENGFRLKTSFQVFSIILLLSLLSISSPASVVHGENGRTCLLVDPAIYVAREAGEVFTVTIDIMNVENLQSARFTVTYNSSFLQIQQVTQGSFFPAPPRSHLEFEKNELFGFVNINITLANLEALESGNGTLAELSFKVINSSGFSPLNLQQSTLFDAASSPIQHETLDGVCFWMSILPDPPVGGRLIDLYTQKGGKGPDQPDGQFILGEEVCLISNVTYNGDPVQNKPVSFQVQNPLNQIIVIGAAFTDQNGIAEKCFTIPSIPSSIGVWEGISVVDIAENATWDTVTFRVVSTSTLPVGGYSLAIEEHTSVKLFGFHLPLAAVLVIGFVAVRRRSTKKTR
jgi:hypothetical protein